MTDYAWKYLAKMMKVDMYGKHGLIFKIQNSKSRNFLFRLDIWLTLWWCNVTATICGTLSTELPTSTVTPYSCYTPTTGGSAAEQSRCYFPFVYKGTEYEACTTRDNSGTPWCSITAIYAQDRLWGNCLGNHYRVTFRIIVHGLGISAFIPDFTLMT